jgi:hypothetical protein
MMRESEIIDKLKALMRDQFDSIDFVRLISITSEPEDLMFSDKRFRPDLLVELQSGMSEKYFLIFEVKSMGQPRYARMAVNQLQAFVGDQPNYYGVFGAPFISDDSKRICQENGIGFIDLAGNCLLKFDNVFIKVEDRKNPYPNTRPLKSIFATKSTRGLRVLLCNPKRDWFVKDFAREANISLGQASNLKQRLLDFELIVAIENKKGSKFRLLEPGSLLDKWTKNYTYRDNTIRNFYSLDDVKTIEKNLTEYLKNQKIQYAFTLTSGAARVAPHLRYQRVFSYVKDDPFSMARDLGFKEVTSGPNVYLFQPYDEGVFYGIQNINDVNVVSDIQLYLDLKSYRERGEEAAEFIREHRLKNQW